MCKYSLTHAGQAMERDLVCTHLHTPPCVYLRRAADANAAHAFIKNKHILHDNSCEVRRASRSCIMMKALPLPLSPVCLWLVLVLECRGRPGLVDLGVEPVQLLGGGMMLNGPRGGCATDKSLR